MAEIGNVTVRVDAVITDEQYHEAIGAVRAANERMDLLEAENAKLREQVADACRQLGGAWVRCTELRELVSILAYCMSDGRDCDRCALNGADMPKPRISACDELPDMLRELGVEVDG